MYTLYSLTADHDCFDVRSLLFELNIEYREKDASRVLVLRELKELTGGKTDVPLLVDDKTKKLYRGKEEIMKYLEESFGEDRYKNIF